MMQRKVIAIWNGNGADGNGLLTAQSGAFNEMPYSFKTRFENENGKLGTNPEELVASALAGCFIMKVAFVLNEAEISPEELITNALLTFQDGAVTSIVLNLEDTSVLFVDVDIPETFAPYVKKGQNADIKFSGNALKKYSGIVESTASRINTNKRSLPVRIKLNNPNNELLSGSLLEISINYNERNSLSILDTSLIMEGDNVYVYKVDKENTVTKVPVEIGLRKKGIVEITSGLEDGDTVVAEGLKKTRPNGKIKPIKYGSKQNSSGWGKKKKSTKEENKK